MPEEESDLEYQNEQALIELKRKTRSRMRVLRRESNPSWVLKASERIQKAVLNCPEYIAAKAVGCYLALPYEVQTGMILDHCRKEGKKVCVPAYYEKEKRYEMTWLEKEDPVQPGRWNIAEPEHKERAGIMDVDCILVPALAYDTQGGRLGHGGGHYDRILGAWTGYKIGVAFDFQVLDEVPQGVQDIPVDLVITETRVLTHEGPISF